MHQIEKCFQKKCGESSERTRKRVNPPTRAARDVGQRNSSFPIMNGNEDDILEEEEEDEEEAELVEQP